MYDQALNSFKDVKIFPVGIVINATNHIENASLIALYGSRMTKFVITRTVHKEEHPYSEYGYSGHTTVQYMVQDDLEDYNLLNPNQEEMLLHYRYAPGMVVADAYDIFSDIIAALDNGLSEPPKEFTLYAQWSNKKINILIDEEAEILKDMGSIGSSEEKFISINPKNLTATKIALNTQQRNFKVWGLQ